MAYWQLDFDFSLYMDHSRPDMALFLFTKAILDNKPIQVFNNGKMLRDFTYIDDIVEGVFRVLEKPAAPDETFDSSNPILAQAFPRTGYLILVIPTLLH